MILHHASPLLIPQFTMSLLLYVLLGLLSLQSCSAATADTVSRGNGLAGSGSKLVSNNSKFALGFFKMNSTSPHSITNPNSYLGTWFNKVSKFTPVWTANGDSPVVDPVSPELAISGDGNLVILDKATKSIIWSTRANITTNRTEAVLLNNGNLVLRSSSKSSIIFWQSFDYPTDTLMPGAKIGWSNVTGLNRRLVSRKNLIDQAPGSYSVELGPNKVGHLVWNSTVEFWSSGEWNGQYFIEPLDFVFLTFEPLHINMPKFVFVENDEESYFMYTFRNESKIVRTKLDVYGRVVVEFWIDSIQDWMINYMQPVFQCDIYATCGPFTLCNDSDHPVCSCMKGFFVRSPGDWELGDRRDGCMRNNSLDCGGLTDRFYSVQSIKLPHDAKRVHAATGEDDCSHACLSNCSCTAYSYGQGGCSVWHGELYNVKQLPDSSSDGNGGILYIRLSSKDVPTVASKKKINSWISIGVAIGASAVALVLLMIALLIWRRKGKKWFTPTKQYPQAGIGITAFGYADLQRATKNFSERLGGGSFGSVFKGYQSDSVTMAVKRLDGAYQGEKQFRAEINSVGVVQHINLVKLIGFCCEGEKRLLVYEYMPNHSLDVLLFKANDTVLDWSARCQIVIGVARGLSYLHTGCQDCIIHCDIKPENILLDASFVPKIADFGMAKVLGRAFTQAMTTMRGTIGYLAPEWISAAAITSKVDVYSYGMVLLEIISGKRNTSLEYMSDGDYSAFFPVQVARKLLEGDIRSLVDERLQGDVNLNEVERVCKVACWCIQDNELARPTMGEVVLFLEGLSELDMPPVPRLLNAITGGSPTSP